MGLTLVDANTKKIDLPTGMLLIIPVTVAATPQYATGGEAITLTNKWVSKGPVAVFIKCTSGFELEFIKATSKVMLYQYNYPGGAAGAATEFPNATNYPAALVSDAEVFIYALYAN